MNMKKYNVLVNDKVVMTILETTPIEQIIKFIELVSTGNRTVELVEVN